MSGRLELTESPLANLHKASATMHADLMKSFTRARPRKIPGNTEGNRH